MAEDLMQFDLPIDRRSIIKVIGVGGGGSNAVNHMFRQGITDVDFVVCNTDAQALANSPVPVKLQLGATLTEGRGAGNKPEQGRQAAIESLPLFEEILGPKTKMVFITAGMGGGTGTGAAPVLAKEAREKGILTVAIVTLPFRFEGQKRMNQALEGIRDIKENVDSLLIINNEKLREIYGDLSLRQAFAKADDVLTIAAKGIAEIITVHGIVNVDFADVHTVMHNSGVSIMGSGTASGENRALTAIQKALTSPLLNNNNIMGARNILLNLTSGQQELTMDEVGIITDFVQESAGQNADIIWGNGYDANLGDSISVTIIATGFTASDIPELLVNTPPQKEVVSLDHSNHASDISNHGISEPNAVSNEALQSPPLSQPVQKTLFAPPGNDPLPDQTATRAPKITVPQANRQKPRTDVPQYKEIPLFDFSEIEKIENIPAYERAHIKIEEPARNISGEVSRYTLSEDDNNGIQINPDNSFLFNNVD